MILVRPSRASRCFKSPIAHTPSVSSRAICRTFSHSPRYQTKNTKSTLPTTPARTRFAPSPTGFLHLGSLRTALFNYLLAKKTGGQFLLRVEDTDTKRTVPGALERLCSDLQWAGLQWDEGPQIEGPYGPYQQSKRTQLYQDHAQKLLETGHAYRCFCSVERLDELARRRKELGLPTDYDRQCAGIAKQQSDDRAHRGEQHVIRLLAPDVYPEVNDLIYGRIGRGKPGTGAVGVTHKHGEITYEDPVLLKSDGKPTYHLANVVDDHHMQITHVVRATEWISSTPKHLALYDAFGWEPPEFAHVGLLVDEVGHKLSKRNFDTDIAHFREMGVLPSTLINFVALLGWSHGQKSDLMTLDELVKHFQMKFTKGNTTVSLEKLWFLQRGHAARLAQRSTSGSSGTEGNEQQWADMVTRITKVVKEAGHLSTVSGVPVEKYTEQLLQLDAKSYSTPEAFYKDNVHFFVEPTWQPYSNPEPQTASTAELGDAAKRLMDTGAEEWTVTTFAAKMKDIVAQECKRLGKTDKASNKTYNKLFTGYMRWILLAGMRGPGIAASMELLGRATCLRRLEEARKLVI